MFHWECFSVVNRIPSWVSQFPLYLLGGHCWYKGKINAVFLFDPFTGHGVTWLFSQLIPWCHHRSGGISSQRWMSAPGADAGGPSVPLQDWRAHFPRARRTGGWSSRLRFFPRLALKWSFKAMCPSRDHHIHWLVDVGQPWKSSRLQSSPWDWWKPVTLRQPSFLSPRPASFPPTGGGRRALPIRLPAGKPSEFISQGRWPVTDNSVI